MGQPRELTVTVVFDLDCEPASGSIRVAAQPARPFVGWMELVHVLGRVTTMAAAGPERDPR